MYFPDGSFLILGTGTFGIDPDSADAFRMMDSYWDHGGRVLDTARCYPPSQEGLSEKIIGRWLARRGHGDSLKISSKGGHPPMRKLDSPRLSKQELSHDVEQSRRALGVDCIDIYWLHRDDTSRPVAELLETLESFRENGWIRHYGASNFSVERLKEASRVAESHGWEGFSANQPMACLGGRFRKPMDIPLLTVLDQAGEKFHQRTNMPLVPYTSQAAGYYEKAVRLGTTHSLIAQHPFNSNGCNNIAKKLATLSQVSGHSISALTLAWWRTKKYPVFPVIGCRTLTQLEDSFSSLSVGKDTLKRLAKLD